MSTANILYLILAALVAAAVVYFLYFYKRRLPASRKWILGSLRFFSLFLLLLLLINPKVSRTEYFVEKQDLVLAVDNSASISYLGEEASITEVLAQFREDPELRERFDLQIIPFGGSVSPGDSLDFKESQTNIAQVFRTLDQGYRSGRFPVVLLSDGNQTVGQDYFYAAQELGQPVYPVVIGDTARYRDLVISQVNVNKYSFLDNRFPVELLLNYSGKGAADSYLQISSEGRTLISRPVSFPDDQQANIVRVEIPSTSVGLKTYQAKLIPLEGERNTANNVRQFVVEVIDQRTSIAIAYSILHPDLGALKKAISSNRQQEVVLLPVEDLQDQNDFDLVILYQPNRAFQTLLEELEKQGRNYWMITGPETDWDFLNASGIPFRQEGYGQTEEFFARLNPGFGPYQPSDLNFNALPPLIGAFGEISGSPQAEVLLYGDVQGIETQRPLLALDNGTGAKKAFLFGTGIWQWRSQSYLQQDSFDPFDSFVGDLIQYLSSGNQRERLSLSYESTMETGEDMVLAARVFDRNYKFDPGAEVLLELSGPVPDQKRTFPLMLRENRYEVNLSGLQPGTYHFTIEAEEEGISKSGTFQILSFEIEKQFLRSNPEKLSRIAHEGKLYFPGQVDGLKEVLLKRKEFMPVQKSKEITTPLIEWPLLLFLIILFLGAEWFLRKYFGQL